MLDKILPLVKNMISIPSVSGDIEKAEDILKVVRQQLPEYKPTTFVSNSYPSLLYSNQKNQTKKFKIILNAHLDVVPGTKEQFKPIEKNGRIYGRGAFDTKSAGAVMILLFKELANKLSYPLGLQLTTDEEPTGEFGTGYQIAQGVRADFVILGESNSNFQITNQSKGRKVMHVTINGKSTHSAYPWNGENAIVKMHSVLEPILKAFPHIEKETFETTVNITDIKIERSASNKIPDNCTVCIDIRYSQKDKDTIVKKITNLLPENISIDINEYRVVHFVDPENFYIKLLKKETTKIIKNDLPLRFAHGTSDAPFFSAVNCDAVEFGPIGDGAHHDEEWVDIKSLEDYYNILKNFLLEVDRQS